MTSPPPPELWTEDVEMTFTHERKGRVHVFTHVFSKQVCRCVDQPHGHPLPPRAGEEGERVIGHVSDERRGGNNLIIVHLLKKKKNEENRGTGWECVVGAHCDLLESSACC